MRNTLIGAAFVAIVLRASALAGDYYVSTAGSDANDGTSRETAFATIAHAVDAAADDDTVRVLAGTYEVTAAISVTEAITIVGDTGDPADVVVRNVEEWGADLSWWRAKSTARVFAINNSAAVLSSIATEGGKIGGAGDNKGGNILIDSNGGTVTNCIIRNATMMGIAPGGGSKTGAGGAGIASSSQNGLITHCVITNNFATRGGTNIGLWQAGGAAAVHMAGGIIRESLIAFNATTNDNFGSAVYLFNAGTLMENCTIAGNHGLGDEGNFYPVFFPAQNTAAQDPIVRNTLFCGNVGTSASSKLFADAWVNGFSATAVAAAYARFVNCATDAELPEGLSMINSGIALTADFRPTVGSSIIDAGAAMQSPVALDLAGNPRVSGDAVDVGCYEYTGSTPPAPVVEPPTLGEVTVTSAITNATVSGTITSVGNNGATACDVYLALDSGAATKIVEGATASFEYVISNLTAETTYSYTLSISNNAETVLGAATSGSFTTEAEPVEPGPGPEPGDAILPGENAAATRQAIQDAIDAAVSTHGTVTLGNGLFEIDAQLNVTGGVALVGQGWTKTTIQPVSGSNARCVLLDEGAKLEGVTLTGGKVTENNGNGAGVWVKNGTISWCCITNNTTSAHYVMGCGVSFSEGQGTIDHSIVIGNTTFGQGTYGVGIGANNTAGPVTIDTCLIADNLIKGGGAGGGIGMKNMNYNCAIRNCTVAGNTANTHAGGIRLENGNGRVTMVNTIAVGNMLSSAESNINNPSWIFDASHSAKCFFGLETETSSVSGSLSGNPKFVDAANGDYHLKSDSIAKGAGASYSGIGKDLDGKDFASSPSIGCYEYAAAVKKSGVIVFVR